MSVRDYIDLEPCSFFRNPSIRRCLLRTVSSVTSGNITLSSPITGYTVGTNTPLTASDSILEAFGNLQGQINALEGASNTPNLLIAATDASGNIIDGVSNVITRTLTGFTIVNSAITAADTILSAFNKTQGQINVRANIASPTFTGTPAAPTAAQGTSTTQLATTAFVTTGLNLKANIADPSFTGKVGINVAPVGMLHIGQGTSAMVSPAGDQGIVMTNNQAYGTRLYMENLLSTSGQRMMMIGNYSNQMVFSSLADAGTSFVHEGIIRLNAGAGTVVLKSMIGTGTRMVVTAADGTLSAQTIPVAAHVDPTLGTTTEIINALIAAGLMAAS